jgi:hypothetical protein
MFVTCEQILVACQSAVWAGLIAAIWPQPDRRLARATDTTPPSHAAGRAGTSTTKT